MSQESAQLCFPYHILEGTNKLGAVDCLVFPKLPLFTTHVVNSSITYPTVNPYVLALTLLSCNNLKHFYNGKPTVFLAGGTVKRALYDHIQSETERTEERLKEQAEVIKEQAEVMKIPSTFSDRLHAQKSLQLAEWKRERDSSNSSSLV